MAKLSIAHLSAARRNATHIATGATSAPVRDRSLRRTSRPVGLPANKPVSEKVKPPVTAVQVKVPARAKPTIKNPISRELQSIRSKAISKPAPVKRPTGGRIPKVLVKKEQIKGTAIVKSSAGSRNALDTMKEMRRKKREEEEKRKKEEEEKKKREEEEERKKKGEAEREKRRKREEIRKKTSVKTLLALGMIVKRVEKNGESELEWFGLHRGVYWNSVKVDRVNCDGRTIFKVAKDAERYIPRVPVSCKTMEGVYPSSLPMLRSGVFKNVSPVPEPRNIPKFFNSDPCHRSAVPSKSCLKGVDQKPPRNVQFDEEATELEYFVGVGQWSKVRHFAPYNFETERPRSFFAIITTMVNGLSTRRTTLSRLIVEKLYSVRSYVIRTRYENDERIAKGLPIYAADEELTCMQRVYGDSKYGVDLYLQGRITEKDICVRENQVQEKRELPIPVGHWFDGQYKAPEPWLDVVLREPEVRYEPRLGDPWLLAG